MMNPRAFVLVAMLFVTAVVSAEAARGDEILFNNGDRVTGHVTNVSGGKITIEGTVFGTVTVDAAAVKSIDQPTTAPTTAPATQPATQPTTQPATQPTTSPTTAPTTSPT